MRLEQMYKDFTDKSAKIQAACRELFRYRGVYKQTLRDKGD